MTANRPAETKLPRTPSRKGGRAKEADDAHAEEEAYELEHQRAVRQGFWRWGRIAFALASLFIVVQLLHMVQNIVDGVLNVLLLLLFGGLVAVVLVPMDRALDRKLPATASALLSLLAAIVVVGGVGYAISLGVIGEAQSLPQNLPHLERPFQDLQQFLSQHGINVSIGSVANSLGINTSGSNIASEAISALSFTVQLLVDVVIVVVSAFWLLRDRVRLRRATLAVLPARWRVETEFGLDAFLVVFGGYLRGQLVLALLVGVLALAGSAALGVPYPFLVGFAAGIFELIPLAGPFIGGAIALLFAYTRSPVLLLPTIALFVVIHVIEGYIVAPRVQGRFVRLHPLVSLLSLLAGAYAGGFLGAFFAVPVASLIAVIVRARVADLREIEPELFAMSPEEQDLRVRRRRLLGEYRLGVAAAIKRSARRLWS